MVGRVGDAPTLRQATNDLQSFPGLYGNTAPDIWIWRNDDFSRSRRGIVMNGLDGGNRTRNLPLPKRTLYLIELRPVW